jgi:sialate O-acetylesterase
VGFFFARRIQEDIEVPIGLLWSAFPGSTVDEWMPLHAWRMEPELKDIADRVESCYPDTAHGRKVLKEHLAEMDAWIEEVDRSLARGTPFPYPQPLLPEPKRRDACGFYNGGIHRGVPFAIKGVLWYQGESDQRNNLWDIELKAMAASWREAFDLKGSGEDIAFYWVQLQRSGDYCSPIVRQKQFNSLKLVPNSGMAVLLDLDVNVHPVNKVDTGIRLAHWALHREYGKKALVPSGPLYASHRIDGSKIIVEFDYADGGLRLGRKELLDPVKFESGREVPNVELAGEDGRWSPSKALIEGPRLIVTSAKVPDPRHVRYCYKNIPEPPFLYNAKGLPAATFTTSEK